MYGIEGAPSKIEVLFTTVRQLTAMILSIRPLFVHNWLALTEHAQRLQRVDYLENTT